MLDCTKKCVDYRMPCPCKSCRLHISYKDEYNCLLVSIDKSRNLLKEGLTLREVADRIGVSFVRVKQIEDKALQKIGPRLLELRD